MRSRALLCLSLAAAPLLAACRQDMHDQPYLEPLEHSRFFDDGRGSRPRIVGTVARGERDFDPHLVAGRVDGALAETFPFEITPEVLARGEERYGIFCAICHDAAGYGEGPIVKRGMKQPASFHEPRLRAAPPGYFFDVITNGFGAMYDYSDRVTPRDRWAIVAWIRVLQLAQDARLADAPPDAKARLEEEQR